MQKRESNLPKPPSFAPKKLQDIRKPRSHTVGGESPASSLDLVSSDRKHEVLEEEHSRLLTQSVDIGSSSSVGSQASPIKTKGLPPKVPPLPAQKGEHKRTVTGNMVSLI